MDRSRSRLRRSLRASAIDGTLNAAMVGFGEIYFAPLALFLGASPFQVGMLATIPMLTGAVFQLLSTRLAHRIGDKHWVVASSAAQSAVCFILAALAWTQWEGYLALLVLVCTYWTLNLGLGPAWNTWMGRMVPAPVRSRYFARRNMPIQLILCFSIVAGGVLLQSSSHTTAGPALGFMLCYIIAGLARVGSTHFLTRQHDPGKGVVRSQPSLRAAVAGFGTQPYGRLILLTIFLITSVNLSAAYFVPYWLKALQLTYVEFTVLTAISFIARVAASPYWGEIARNYGNRRALQVALVLVCPLPALWNVSDNFAYMVALQILSGFAWAGFDLCHVLNLFDCTTERNRSQVLSLYNLLNSSSIVVGSLLGGAFLRWMGDSGYAYLFVLSSLGRIVAVLVLARGVGAKLRAERPFANVFLRVITLRPRAG